ncbi:Aminopeptidase Y [Ascochyta lentis]
MIIIHKHLNKDAVVAYLNRHMGEVHNLMLLDLQEFYRKRVATLKADHNQTMREAHDEIRRLHTKFDRVNSEYDWILAVYQDQMRTSQEQEDRITFLEVKLKEFGQLTPSATPAPFSAPASQINFTNPPRRVRGAVRSSSPLSQTPLVQVQETEEE